MKNLLGRAYQRLYQFVPPRGRRLRYGPWAGEVPKTLFIEPIRQCNLRCKMCPLHVYKREEMITMKQLEYIINQFPTADRIELQGLGEPMLHPELSNMITIAAKRGIETHFITNGTLLTYDNCRKLISAGLSWITVSIDAATPTTYEYIRGGDLNTVLSNLRSLQRAKREAHTSRPEISFQTIRMKCNLSELTDLIDLGHELEVKHISIGDIIITGDPRVDESFNRSEHLSTVAREEAVPKLEALRAYAERRKVVLYMAEYPESDTVPGKSSDDILICDSPWTMAYIAVDGGITPCCYASNPEAWDIGNIFKVRFEHLWNGSRYRRLRMQLLRGEDPVTTCRGCPARTIVPYERLS